MLRQVLRYSALVFGVFYGFSHQKTLNANAKVQHEEHEYRKKESLIEKAKLEWAKKSMPPQSKTGDGGSKSELIHNSQSSRRSSTFAIAYV